MTDAVPEDATASTTTIALQVVAIASSKREKSAMEIARQPAMTLLPARPISNREPVPVVI